MGAPRRRRPPRGRPGRRGLAVALAGRRPPPRDRPRRGPGRRHLRRGARGAAALVDGGPGGGARFDVGERVVAPYLWNRGAMRLDVVAATHADADHSGGLAAVLRQFTVREVWENGRWGSGHEDVVAALERSGAARRILSAGQRIRLGERARHRAQPARAGGPSRPRPARTIARSSCGWTGAGSRSSSPAISPRPARRRSWPTARRSPPPCSGGAPRQPHVHRGGSREREPTASRGGIRGRSERFGHPAPRSSRASAGRARGCIAPTATAPSSWRRTARASGSPAGPAGRTERLDLAPEPSAR